MSSGSHQRDRFLEQRPHARVLGLEVRARQIIISCARVGLGKLAAYQRRNIDIDPDSDPLMQLGGLMHTLEEEGWAGLPCVVSLHGDATIMRVRQLPFSDDVQIKQRIASEVERFTARSPFEMITASDYLNNDEGGVALMFAVAKRDTAAKALELPRALGLPVLDVVPGVVALYNGMRPLLPETGLPVIVMDVGQRVTEVLIAVRDRPYFARSVSAPLDDAATPGDQWFSEVAACLELYLSDKRNAQRTPERALLCGALASPSLARRIENFGVQVEWVEEIPLDEPLRSVVDYPIAAGLVRSGLRKSGVRLSMLPPDLAEANLLKTRLYYWRLIAFVLLALMLGIFNLLNWSAMTKQQALEVKMGQWVAVQKAMSKAGRDEVEIQELKRKTDPVAAAVRNGVVLRRVVQELAGAKHPDDWITLVSDAYSYDRVSAYEPPSESDLYGPRRKPGSLEDGLNIDTIVVEGYTPIEDFSTVNSMIETLREVDGVANADLLGDDRLREDAIRNDKWERFKGRLFAIEIEVNGS